ncbi:MAG TPA: hypothetical protein DCQ92_07270 [Verrucomicrobia subdivision 3 bacterium]|nr:hypothetical protein [Limisphaerales bacterium]
MGMDVTLTQNWHFVAIAADKNSDLPTLGFSFWFQERGHECSEASQFMAIATGKRIAGHSNPPVAMMRLRFFI